MIDRTAEQSQTDSRYHKLPVLLVIALSLAAGNVMLGVFSAVQEAAKAELHFSDMQMAMLNGLAVSLPLAVLAIPTGLLVDRVARVPLLFGTALFWTLGTILTAVASTMPLLFTARMLAGLGANISTTIAISLAADLSPPERRGRSLLLLTVGKYAGTGLAFALGGTMLGIFTAEGGIFGLSPWRSVHAALGIASLVIAMCLPWLGEPRRHEVRNDGRSSVMSTIRELVSYRRLLVPLFLGQTSVLMADAAATVWAAPVLSRAFGLKPEQFAGWMGLVVFGAGILGAVIGGVVADAAQGMGRRNTILRGAVIASFIAIPAALFPIATDIGVFATALFILLLGGTITGLVTATALAVLLPNELRGLAVGSFVAIGGLIAFGLAPPAVVAISTTLGGEAHLAPALALVGLTVSLLGAVGFFTAARSLSPNL